MENRYEDDLRKNNQAILKLSPANETLRFVVAQEFNTIYTPGKRVLEMVSSGLLSLIRTGRVQGGSWL